VGLGVSLEGGKLRLIANMLFFLGEIVRVSFHL
jgi:hypothetical protein